MSLKQEISGRLKKLMFGLFYPAVLGTFFFGLLPKLLELVRGEPVEIPKLLLAMLIVMHFVADIMFTEEVEKEYSTTTFLIDLTILGVLFVAYEAIHLDTPGSDPEILWIGGSLGFAYLLYRLWARVIGGAIGSSKALAEYEWFAVSYFILVTVVGPPISSRVLPQAPQILSIFLLASGLAVFTFLMLRIGWAALKEYHAGQEIDSEEANQGFNVTGAEGERKKAGLMKKPNPIAEVEGMDLQATWRWAFHEDNLLHTRLQIFLTAQALLVAAIGFMLDDSSRSRIFILAVAGLGLFLSLFWLAIQARCRKLVRSLEAVLKERDPLYTHIIANQQRLIKVGLTTVMTVILPTVMSLWWVLVLTACALGWIQFPEA